MRLSRLTEAGLSWSLAKGAPHIKICSVDSAANPLTVQALWDTITSVGGSNLALPSNFSIVGATLLRDTHRAMQVICAPCIAASATRMPSCPLACGYLCVELMLTR